MAEYSKEFTEKYFPALDYDFSFVVEFYKLREGERKNLICEGFGVVAIEKRNGNNICILRDGMEVYFDELIIPKKS